MIDYRCGLSQTVSAWVVISVKLFAGIHKSNDTRQVTFILLLKSCKPVLNVARFVEFLIKKIILIAIDQNADP